MTAAATGLERPVVFGCHGEALCGVLHPPPDPATARGTGVIVVVGGPQYRAGSHRQFVLLARALAAAGFPALRFDHRGIGDSAGARHGFEAIGDDVSAAIDRLCQEQPQVHEIVLWGLCDAAAAAAFHAATDRRVRRLILLNPWVRTDVGEARAQLRHHYRRRLRDPAFWRKLATLRWNPLRSLRGLRRVAGRARTGGGGSTDAAPLPERVRRGLAAFDGRVLVILSGNDLTAREFEDCLQPGSAWSEWLARPTVTLARVPYADHTFSRAEWRDRVAAISREWLDSA